MHSIFLSIQKLFTIHPGPAKICGIFWFVSITEQRSDKFSFYSKERQYAKWYEFCQFFLSHPQLDLSWRKKRSSRRSLQKVTKRELNYRFFNSFSFLSKRWRIYTYILVISRAAEQIQPRTCTTIVASWQLSTKDFKIIRSLYNLVLIGYCWPEFLWIIPFNLAIKFIVA